MKLFYGYRVRLILSSILIFGSILFVECKSPRVSIIFVVDQFAYNYIDKLRLFFKGGLNFFLENGVVYKNAYFPHAMPSTAIGHTALNTGVYAKDHGIIANKWYDHSGNQIIFPYDNGERTEVFGKKGNLLSEGISARLIKAIGVSDQFVLHQQSFEKENYVYSLSLKDRAAVGASGALGKPIWFDSRTGCFTTSRYFFDRLPKWVVDFNKKKKIDKLEYIKWKPIYRIRSDAYKFQHATNYEYTRYQSSLVGTSIKVFDPGKEKSFAMFEYMPQANQLVLDLGLACINDHLKNKKGDGLLLWIALSSMDKLGHIFGPDSIEMLDMIYHLDIQLKYFIKMVRQKIPQKDLFLVFTSDHGVEPIPELLQEKGLKSVFRINSDKLIKKMNELVSKKHDISKLIIAFRFPQFFFNNILFDKLDKNQKLKVIEDLKDLLKKTPGIKNVWTYDELASMVVDTNAIEYFFKQQLYPGRSGHLFVQPFPFCQMGQYKEGTGHRTPYEHNTHVPLIIYQRDQFEKKIIRERVSMLQFANTIAEILNIPKPSASTFDILPGLF